MSEKDSSIGNNRILVVDDDKDFSALLQTKLEVEGFRVEEVADGEAALRTIAKRKPDLIILEVNMPKMNGMEVCRTLRSDEKTKNIPIVMLTARDEEVDRILGLEFGADDYVTKPCSIRELILRIKNVIRRSYGRQDDKEVFEHGSLWVDLQSHEVKVKGKSVELTLTEFKLLAHLIENPGKVQSRDFLLDRVWEYGDNVFSRTIDTHIQRLRSKLKGSGKSIKTIRGVGYRFED